MSVMKINRIEKLQQQMEAAGVGQLLVEDEKNRQYLTYADIWEGSLLVKPEGAWLLVDFRYYEMAKRYTRDCEVVLCADIDETLGRLTDADRDLAIEQSPHAGGPQAEAGDPVPRLAHPQRPVRRRNGQGAAPHQGRL